MKVTRTIFQLLVTLMTVIPSSLLAQDAADIAKAYHQAEAENIISDFRTFLSLPNVASDHADMQANAAFIQKYIGMRGFSSKVVSAG